MVKLDGTFFDDFRLSNHTTRRKICHVGFQLSHIRHRISGVKKNFKKLLEFTIFIRAQVREEIFTP